MLWEQYIPFSRASRALRNGPDPIETNRDGDVHINLAVVGYAKDSPRWSDALLRELAEFVVWAEEEWGIPAEFHYQFGGGEGYGYDGRYRLDPAVYNKAEGVLGHTHAPDTNTHWDPGAIPVDKLTQLIGELKTVATFADVPEDYWAYSAVEWMAAEGLTKGSGTDADGNPLFKPEDPVTRGELAVFLRRFHDRFV